MKKVKCPWAGSGNVCWNVTCCQSKEKKRRYKTMMTINNNNVLAFEFWSRNPVKIEELQKPRELNDRDIMALRYAAEELLTNGFMVYEDRALTREQVAKESSVCSDELNLGDFEGYRISPTAVIRSLFFNEDNRIIAEVLTDDEEYEHYLVY